MTRPRAESDINHVRCRGAKSFVDDLGLSRGVVLSRAVHFCDLLRLSPLTRRFVRFRRTSLLFVLFFFCAPSIGLRCSVDQAPRHVRRRQIGVVEISEIDCMRHRSDFEATAGVSSTIIIYAYRLLPSVAVDRQSGNLHPVIPYIHARD
jgi:hypothetical protein